MDVPSSLDVLRKQFDVTFPALQCLIISLDSMDISGERQLSDKDHTIFFNKSDWKFCCLQACPGFRRWETSACNRLFNICGDQEGHPPSNHPPLLRQTRLLKLEPKCCTECARKVKRAMLKVEGVHSIKVNANEGTIEVNSEIDLQVLIAMGANAGKTAELLWEPEPESPEEISTATPSLATPSTYQRQVHVSNFDQTLHLQELVDRNARGIKQMEIIDKRVIKITFKESHDDPSSVHSRDSPSPIAPPSSDSKSRNGSDGGASGSGACGNVEVVAAPAIAVEPPPKINDAPCNSKPAEPRVANVNCSSRGNSCRLM